MNANCPQCKCYLIGNQLNWVYQFKTSFTKWVEQYHHPLFAGQRR